MFFRDRKMRSIHFYQVVYAKINRLHRKFKIWIGTHWLLMGINSHKLMGTKHLSRHSGQFLILQTVHGSMKYPFRMIHPTTRLLRTTKKSQSLLCRRKLDTWTATELATETPQTSKIFLLFYIIYDRISQS